VLAEDRSATDARVEKLMREVEALTKKVEELATRLAAMEAARTGEAPTTGAAPSEPELDRALSFAERLMQRFFDLVRQLKTEEPGQPI
jgi:uncharacterized protein YaaN involved in tellurite resistance